ncbi:MAG: UbiX family flavin prenyltransferase [Bacteroidetes bacterium]|nr:MAG: UbiX family flavin prenyltransferase [Bacteroidota bacterium]REK04879.1 MAG: UbiX family flavin prenyltransferase [Bacteroidota bacterium]REK36351.1 MAG: UbiX family flavin prenyltransferase [Bacteroidota bacterium]REK50983.1 MAG: UbiX family flavin prenyltransferase [Bacteroidota bacterium]
MSAQSKQKVVIASTGASGAIYTKVLLDKLRTIRNQIEDAGLVMSDNARDVWEYELGNRDFEKYEIKVYEKNDFFAPFASGSAKFASMIICPCSMGTLARIAAGISNDLITRAADVMLKERRRLIIVLRDTPYSLVHINNMKIVTQAGGIICPASPSFYSKPIDFEELASTVVDRALELAGFDLKTFRWSENKPKSKN